MWETIKNDPILRTFAVLILGALSFGLAFNVMFGANGSGGGEHGAGAGYSLGSSMSNLGTFLIKLLFIVVIVAILIIVVKAIKTYLFERSETGMKEYIKNDPIIKAALLIILAVVTLGVTVFVFNGILGGTGGANYSGMQGYGGGYGGYYGNGGYMNQGFSILGVLIFLVKLLLVISIVGLLVGLGVYVLKNKNFTLESLNFLAKEPTTEGTGNDVNVFCKGCGVELKKQWKCCPECGLDKKESEVTAEEVKVEKEESKAETVVEPKAEKNQENKRNHEHKKS